MKKKVQKLSLDEVFESISTIANMKIEKNFHIGITPDFKFIFDDSGSDNYMFSLTPDSSTDILEASKRLYLTMVDHVHSKFHDKIVENDTEWIKNISDIIQTAGVAAKKLDDLIVTSGSLIPDMIVHSKEYCKLRDLYINNIVPFLNHNVDLFDDQDYELESICKHPLKDITEDDNETSLLFQKLKDQEARGIATQILSSLTNCKIKHLSSKDDRLLQSIVMSLNMAKHDSEGKKTPSEYIEDFQSFLREFIDTLHYQKILRKKEGSIFSFQFITTVALAFFKRKPSTRTEVIALIHKILKSDTHISIMDTLSLSHNAILSWFKSNKTKNKKIDHFDPNFQGNYPHFLYEIGKIEVLKIASPTSQKSIEKASIIPEFVEFLHGYISVNKTHLMINLQDKNSWKSQSRVMALERLKFSSFHFTSLDKNSDFYHQIGSYHNMRAKKFLLELKKNLRKICFFPKQIKDSEIVDHIHKTVFKGKELDLRDRLDFIEIVQLFITDAIVDYYKPDSISFTCKDCIDKGACMSALYYYFYKKRTKEYFDINLFYWLIYGMAMVVRKKGCSLSSLLQNDLCN